MTLPGLKKILKYLELKHEAMTDPPLIGGRRTSKKIVWCDCGWLGFRKDLFHDYGHDMEGEVDEFIDLCPGCFERKEPKN
jgi:hypothetical protein